MCDFCDVPEGLNAGETKLYLREHGDQLCYLRLSALALTAKLLCAKLML